LAYRVLHSHKVNRIIWNTIRVDRLNKRSLRLRQYKSPLPVPAKHKPKCRWDK